MEEKLTCWSICLPMRRQIQSEHVDRSGGRSDQSQQHLNRRRLAGAIRPKQSENLARPDVERNPVDRGEVTESLGEIADFNDGVDIVDMRYAF